MDDHCWVCGYYNGGGGGDYCEICEERARKSDEEWEKNHPSQKSEAKIAEEHRNAGLCVQCGISMNAREEDGCCAGCGLI